MDPIGFVVGVRDLQVGFPNGRVLASKKPKFVSPNF